MLTFDIPVNLKVVANTEEEAEQIVSTHVDKIIDKDIPLLNRTIIEWDFIEFVEGEEDEPDSEFFMGS